MIKRPGLRQRKFARTRLNLSQALARRLEQSSLEEVVVRDLCDDVEVSEATFFNYFPRKLDLLDYHTQLWMLDLSWRCQSSEAQGVAAIAVSFDFMAASLQKQSGVMGEMIARQALLREKPEPIEIGLAERQIAYPDYEGIEALPVGGVDKAWLPALEQAIRSGELPANSHIPTVMVGLAAIFYGVPLVLRQVNLAAISSAYTQQLVVFWAGIRSAARGAT